MFLIIPTFITPIAFGQEYQGVDRTLEDVAKDLDENKNGFDIDYTLEGTLDPKVMINQEEKSITFFYNSEGIEEDVLIIHLPRELIDDPIGIYVDGVLDTNAIRNMQDEITTIYIPLFLDDKEITIYGTSVIPEFGSMITILMALSISIMIIFTFKFKFIPFSLKSN
jgi:hypothetical protein